MACYDGVMVIELAFGGFAGRGDELTALHTGMEASNQTTEMVSVERRARWVSTVPTQLRSDDGPLGRVVGWAARANRRHAPAYCSV